MNRLVMVVALACACGQPRLGGDGSIGPSIDASVDAAVDGSVDAAIDAAIDGPVALPDAPIDAGTLTLAQRAYLKASNTDSFDWFGSRIALSADGSTLAVAADRECSAARGIDGNQKDNAAANSGAVYVFTRTRTGWAQQAYVKASNTDTDDHFGSSIALSADGSTLAVGAFGESSSGKGVSGDQSDNSAPSAGAVYVFVRSGSAWTQQAYIKASNTDEDDGFGARVALSSSGSTLAVSALNEASAATTVDGDQGDNSAPGAGAVYVFTRRRSVWTQQAYVKPLNTDAGDFFGYSLALSGDGLTLAVGAYGEASTARGIDGDATDNTAPRAGAVYVFIRAATSWKQEAYIKASNTDEEDIFGSSIALAADGSTLAVGTFGESSAARGVGGDQDNNSAARAGAVYVLARAGDAWTQQAYVKASNPGGNDQFGISVALSADGSTLVAGAYGEDGAATGIDGDQRSEAASNAGAAYLFRRADAQWTQQAYVKASNADVSDLFGGSVALSGDGATLVIGATFESSAATGVDGDQSSNSMMSAGAAYVFQYQ